MPERRKETALVTGASAGIGLELAGILAEKGFDLALVARRETELLEVARQLEAAHGVHVTVHPLDLLQQNAGEQLWDELERADVVVDVLVNNAGVIEIGSFQGLPLDRLLRLVQLNALVVTELCHRFLAPMVGRGHGRILNVASLAAFQPVPALALYAATKAFVLSLSESLSEELKGTGVTVTALCPGLTRTHMVEQAEAASPLVRRTPDFLISDSHEVAVQGIDACLSGRVVVVPGAPNRLQASLVGFYPRSLVRALSGMIGRRSL
jgi:short-subunit dehydrogenase